MLYFLMATSGFAQTDVNLILEKIQKRNKDLSSLEADFIQVTTNEAFPEPIEQSGHLFAMRPKFLRWDFQVPMVQSYYTDGKSITVWNEQNNQVLISEEMSDANEAFDVLTDFSNAQKKYNITNPTIFNIISYFAPFVPEFIKMFGIFPITEYEKHEIENKI